MDLLGYIRQEAGDEKMSYSASTHGANRGKAATLLLARLPSPLKQAKVSAQRQLFRSEWVRAKIGNSPPYGAVAQMGERIPRTDEVTGSNPVCSIHNPS